MSESDSDFRISDRIGGVFSDSDSDRIDGHFSDSDSDRIDGHFSDSDSDSDFNFSRSDRIGEPCRIRRPALLWTVVGRLWVNQWTVVGRLWVNLWTAVWPVMG